MPISYVDRGLYAAVEDCEEKKKRMRAMSTLRQDPISGGWVIFSEERALRPTDLASPEVERGNPATCPFCEGHESLTPPEISAYRNNGAPPDSPGWRVRTVANKFAALKIEGELESHAEGMYDAMNGIGAHEVIIETPRHHTHMGEYPAEHLTGILRMYRERAEDLYRDERFRYIQLFKNYGSSAGASLAHPHSQIIALPITPRWVKEELNSSRQHYQMKERCLFCDVMAEEMHCTERIVFQNEQFLSFMPFASKFPFET